MAWECKFRGRFWTSKYDEISMERVANFVTNYTDEEWQIEINKISNNDKILYDLQYKIEN